MNKVLRLKCVVVLLLALLGLNAQSEERNFVSRFSADKLEQARVKLIPFPQEVEWGKETLQISDVWFASYKQTSKLLKDELYQICSDNGIELNPTSKYRIEFTVNTDIAEEGYRLKISETGISITASNETGHYYGLKTLRQLITLDDERSFIPFCSINDYPKFPIRGYMIDVGRNFQSLKALKKQLDIMAQYKMNIFHWHLTDGPAWRLESKIYPQLNLPENNTPTRDPGYFYTFDEVRELIAYAAKRKIKVIPELDMPGHSGYFKKTFGFKMETEKGMLVLEALLNEFFNEIPKEMAPIIHLGSDEVHVPNPKEFVSKMVSLVEGNGREAVIWYPGLEAGKSVIRQVWGSKDPMEARGLRVIDSDNSYINNGEPMSQIPAIFLKPIGHLAKNDVIGGIICLWPDVNIRRENDVISQNPLYPSLLTYAWATWTADVVDLPESFGLQIPEVGSEGFKYFNAFEDFLMEHKNRHFANEPFAYTKQCDKQWRMIGPIADEDCETVLENTDKASFNFAGKKLKWKEISGNTFILNHSWKKGSHLEKVEPGNAIVAVTTIESDSEKDVPVWISFNTPARNSRNAIGVARDGEFDVSGGSVWVNGKKLVGPAWKLKRIDKKDEVWKNYTPHEMPWTKEELYWTRKPHIVHLKKGKNKVVVRIPKANENSSLMFTFTVLEEEGLTFDAK